MGYHESALSKLPDRLFKLNVAETAYVDITGKGGALAGTLSFCPSVLAGSPKSISLTGGTAVNVTTNVFKKGNEKSPFTLAAWFAPLTSANSLSILSHNAIYDGLSFDGNFIKFGIKSAASNMTEAKWPVPDFAEAYFVVGVYSIEKIQLFINGEMVAEEEIPAEILEDGFAQEPSVNLYAGQSPVTTERGSIDGIAIYATALEPHAVVDQFVQGRDVISMRDAVNSKGGTLYDGVKRTIAASDTISGDMEWTDSGQLTDCSVVSGELVPTVDQTTLLSKAGSWRYGIPVGVTESTSSFGTIVEWDGDGNFVVESSLDESVWSPVQNGRLVVGSVGLNTTVTPVIHLRITFTGGLVDDPAVVRRVSWQAYTDEHLLPDTESSRSILLSGNVVGALTRNEPIERNIKSGMDTYGGAGYLLADSSSTPVNIQTFEFWIRMRSNASSSFGGYVFDARPATSSFMWIPKASGTIDYGGMTAVYVNGVAVSSGSASIKYNEWNHIVAVLTTSFNDIASFAGDFFDGQYGMIATYPTALTAAQALELYRSYTKLPSAVVTDTGVTTIAEAATPFVIYGHDWDITSGG